MPVYYTQWSDGQRAMQTTDEAVARRWSEVLGLVVCVDFSLTLGDA